MKQAFYDAWRLPMTIPFVRGVAMIGPSSTRGLFGYIDGLPILIAGNYASIKPLYCFEFSSFGHYLLMVMVFSFAFSTMFSLFVLWTEDQLCLYQVL